MRDDEFQSVLDHLRTQLVELGRSDLNERISADFGGTGQPGEDLARYIERLAQVLESDSQDAYRRTISLLNDNIEVEQGGRIEEIELEVLPEHRAVYGANRLTLSSTARDLTPIVEELRGLLLEVRREIDRGWGILP